MGKSLLGKVLYCVTLLALLWYCIVGIQNKTIYTDELRSDRISLFVLLGLLVISLFYFKGTNKKNQFASSYIYLIVYIYGISVLHSIVNPSDLIRYVTMALPIMMFMFSRNSFNTISSSNEGQLFFLVSLVVLTYYYFNAQLQNSRLESSDYFHSNSSYYLLYLLPLLLCNKRELIRWAALLVTAIAIFSSTKRGGAIAFVLGLLIYVYTRYFVVSTRRSRFSGTLFSIVVVGLILFVTVSYWGESVDVVIDRIENNNDAGGRGRLTIYTTVVNMIVQSSPLNILFGHGWNQVIVDNPIGLSAHNDFLECIYDFGIIGLFLFLAYVFNMIKYTFHLLKEKSSIGPAMAVAVIIFLVNSSVSHILIYPAFAMQFALFFGYVIGNQEFHSATGSRVIVP